MFKTSFASRRLPFQGRRAFTIIEIIIVVAIIAIIAATAIPSLISSRAVSYETAAIGTLRALLSAETTFVTRTIVDQDEDGNGEYGFFRELTGVSIPRSKAAALASGDVFSRSFGSVDENGVVSKSGYCFIIYLPTAGGPAVTEAGGVPAANPDDADVQEAHWLCYGWPAAYSHTGYRVFAVSEQGQILQANNEGTDSDAGIYDGRLEIPQPGAALLENGGRENNLDSRFPHSGEAGSDGQLWTQVGGG